MEKPEWLVYTLNRHDYDGDLKRELFVNFAEMREMEIEKNECDQSIIEENRKYYSVKTITELFGCDEKELSEYIHESEGFSTALLTLLQEGEVKAIPKSEWNGDPMALFEINGIKALFGLDPVNGIEWLLVKSDEIDRFIETIHNADIW